MVNEEINSEVCGKPIVYVFNGSEPMTFHGISFIEAEDADVMDDVDYLKIRQQMEFSAECTVSPKFIKDMRMAIGTYWIGKVPRVVMKRWWR